MIHKWKLPKLGLKIDKNPNRLNKINKTFIYKGLFYGQCREICGKNHKFIPIVVEIKKL